MPSRIDFDKIVADNPDLDLELFRKGEKELEALQRTGAVRPSTYSLDTPESKRGSHSREGSAHTGYERATRRLR